MKKFLLSFCTLFVFSFSCFAQNSLPSSGFVGIGTSSPAFPLHVDGVSRYTGLANFGETYDPVLYSKGIQISRPGNQPDSLFHLSFVRAGQQIVGMGFLKSSNTFAIQNGPNNTSSKGIFLAPNGFVGIGNSNPEYTLDITGEARIGFTRLFINTSGVLYSDGNNMAMFHNGGYIFANKSNTQNRAIIESNGSLNLYAPSGGGAAIRFSTIGDSYINTGNLGIGTINPGNYKLAVEGTIGARRVKVQQGSWADFVFHPDYQLPSLQYVESFIRDHQHLPDIPSEKEVNENGLDLGDMNKKLLQKVEELTLYIIDLRKEMDQLKKTVETNARHSL